MRKEEELKETEEERPRKRVESLGWLTESAVMPKKHKAIEGVGAGSIVELKAQLYRSQEEARKTKEAAPDADFHRAKKKPLPADLFSHKNSGVDTRDRRDKLELKAINDGSAVYAALEKKAQLYEKLARGELPDEEDKEKYCVDFFQKTLEHDESHQNEAQDIPCAVPPQTEDGETDGLLPREKPFILGHTSSIVDNEEHKRFVREVHEEANQAREKVTKAKLRREEAVTARREKLKEAYLRKKLENLISARQRNVDENSLQAASTEVTQK